MKTKKLILVLTLVIFLLPACASEKTLKKESESSSISTSKVENVEKITETEASITETEVSITEENVENKTKVEPYIKEIIYSNLVDVDSRDLIMSALYNAGIGDEDIEDDSVYTFLKIVEDYNSSAGNEVGLVESGFKKVATIDEMGDYDFIAIDEKWNLNHKDFIGYNCRLTSFLLAFDFLNIDGSEAKIDKFLFLDDEAIANSNNSFLTEENTLKFYKLFATIPVELHKDVKKHVSSVKKYWDESGISFNDIDAKFITVWFHDDLDNMLFIGHTGILLPNPEETGFLFIEKVSFQEPYQMLKLKDRQELNDYLMAKYDISYGQPTAKPFIMENADLIETYRPNPLNDK